MHIYPWCEIYDELRIRKERERDRQKEIQKMCRLRTFPSLKLCINRIIAGLRNINYIFIRLRGKNIYLFPRLFKRTGIKWRCTYILINDKCFHLAIHQQSLIRSIKYNILCSFTTKKLNFTVSTQYIIILLLKYFMKNYQTHFYRCFILYFF